MQPESDDMQALFDADCRFHVTILEATQNQVMRQMRQIILTMLRVSYEYRRAAPGERPGHAGRGHIAVAEAIARHDGPQPPATAMADMLHRNESIAERYWREFQPDASGVGL